MKIFQKKLHYIADIWPIKPYRGMIIPIERIEYCPRDMQIILHVNHDNVKRIILHLEYIDRFDLYDMNIAKNNSQRIATWTVESGWKAYSMYTF